MVDGGCEIGVVAGAGKVVDETALFAVVSSSFFWTMGLVTPSCEIWGPVVVRVDVVKTGALVVDGAREMGRLAGPGKVVDGAALFVVVFSLFLFFPLLQSSALPFTQSLSPLHASESSIDPSPLSPIIRPFASSLAS